MSKPITKEEARKLVLEHIYEIKEFWEKETPNRNLKEKLEGCIFSILAMMDGASPGIPSIGLCLNPHVDDMAYYIKNGEDYFEAGQCISDDVELHDMWAKLRAEKNG